MTEKQLARLKAHIFQIARSFVTDMSEDNCVLGLDEHNRAMPEAVCNHHLITLLARLNPSVFVHYCDSLFKWLASPSNGYGGHPFTLDSYTQFCVRNPENETLYRESIAKFQLADGSVPIYTALFQGGDFFSTLWATKILIEYDAKAFSGEIAKAIEYLLSRETIAARSPSQSGFMLFILLRHGADSHLDRIKALYEKLLPHVNAANFTDSSVTHVGDMYLLQDMIEYHAWSKDSGVLDLVGRKLALLFELDKEPHLPSAFERWSKFRPQQPYLQMLLLSAIVAAEYVRAMGQQLPTIELNAHLHGHYREIKYLGMRAERELAKYKLEYDAVENEFRRYDEPLKAMWGKSRSTQARSIFLMMPFRKEMKYRELTRIIKLTCKRLGFKAFRVDDKYRAPFDTLWENIVLNMLGCKYGIAVYVSDKAVDKMTDQLRFFQNPNVALEYGFMKSRGKKVLILKDAQSIAPSDLQGFLWRDFDLENPDTTVSTVLEPWLREISAEDGQQAAPRVRKTRGGSRAGEP